MSTFVTSLSMVIRTIRHSRVKIKGKWYYPPDGYDGRLDGLRMLFALYPEADEIFVFLWGSKQCLDGDEDDHPEMVDGTLPWCWWYPRSEPHK